jgi:tRNA G10  N-methylase Trm11
MRATSSGLPENIDIILQEDPYCPALSIKIPNKLRRSITIHDENIESLYEQILRNVERVYLEDILFEFVAAQEPPLTAKLNTVQQVKALITKIEQMINERIYNEEMEKNCASGNSEE